MEGQTLVSWVSKKSKNRAVRFQNSGKNRRRLLLFSRKKPFLFLGLFVLLGTFSAGAQTTRVRTLSMGGLCLAVPDTDNQLNFYDFGGNPAGLQSDQKFRWMRVYLNADNHWGGYRRLYEPSDEQNYSLSFEGVKALNPRETFWGRITYSGDYPHGVYRSLEKQPYSKNFILTDTTTGNYWYNGPSIQTIYSRKLPQNFALGLRFNYKVQMGLKDVYTKVESIQREIFPGIGLSWSVPRKGGAPSAPVLPLSTAGTDFPSANGSAGGIGFYCFPYDNQTRLTAVKEMRDAVVYRQIGLSTRFRQVRGKYVRIYRTKGVLLGGQVFMSPFRHIRFGVSHRYWAAGTSTTDNLFVKRGYEQQIQNKTVGRVVFRKAGWQIGAQVLRESSEDWSKSVVFQCLYGEQARRRWTAGLGVGTTEMPVILGAEFYAGRFERTYRDYLSHQKITVRQPEWEVRAGLEVPLFSEKWQFRLGGMWGRQVPDLFYWYSREKVWRFGGGISWQATYLRVVLLGVFHSRLPVGSPFEVNQPLYEGAPYWPAGHRQRASVQLLVQLWGK